FGGGNFGRERNGDSYDWPEHVFGGFCPIGYRSKSNCCGIYFSKHEYYLAAFFLSGRKSLFTLRIPKYGSVGNTVCYFGFSGLSFCSLSRSGLDVGGHPAFIGSRLWFNFYATPGRCSIYGELPRSGGSDRHQYVLSLFWTKYRCGFTRRDFQLAYSTYNGIRSSSYS